MSFMLNRVLGLGVNWCAQQPVIVSSDVCRETFDASDLDIFTELVQRGVNVGTDAFRSVLLGNGYVTEPLLTDVNASSRRALAKAIHESFFISPGLEPSLDQRTKTWENELKAAKLFMLSRVRGVLFCPSVCDIIFSYIPWFDAVTLAPVQIEILREVQATAVALSERDHEIQELKKRLQRLEANAHNGALLCAVESKKPAGIEPDG